MYAGIVRDYHKVKNLEGAFFQTVTTERNNANMLHLCCIYAQPIVDAVFNKKLSHIPGESQNLQVINIQLHYLL